LCIDPEHREKLFRIPGRIQHLHMHWHAIVSSNPFFGFFILVTGLKARDSVAINRNHELLGAAFNNMRLILSSNNMH